MRQQKENCLKKKDANKTTTEVVHPKCPPFLCWFLAWTWCKFSYFTNTKWLWESSLSLWSFWCILLQIKLGLFRENLKLKKHLWPKKGWSSPSTFRHRLTIYIYALHCYFFLPMYIHSFVCFLNFGGSAVSFFNRFAWYLANDPSSRLYCPYSWNRNNVHLCYQQKQYRINIIIMSSQTVSVLQLVMNETEKRRKKNSVLMKYFWYIRASAKINLYKQT